MNKQPTNRTWNVHVHRDGRSLFLGTVVETTEDNARCAALSRFSRHEDDQEPHDAHSIGPDDDFDVSPT